MNTVLACAILLTSKQALPAPLVQMYHHAYHCTAATSAPPRKPARTPVRTVRQYFPTGRRFWPVVAWYSPNLVSRVTRIRRHGVRPALLLPPLAQFGSRMDIVNKLQKATGLGAIPVVTLRRRTVASQHDALVYWCSLDMCPGAWYIPGGISLHLADLKSGLYLTGPHWRGHRHWPVPARMQRFDSQHRVMPMYHRVERVNGVAATLTVSNASTWFTPDTTPVAWHFLGFDLERTATGLQGDRVALFLLGVSGLSISLWSRIANLSNALILYVTHLFSWLWLWVLAINLVVLGVYLFLGTGFARRRKGVHP